MKIAIAIAIVIAVFGACGTSSAIPPCPQPLKVIACNHAGVCILPGGKQCLRATDDDTGSGQ